MWCYLGCARFLSIVDDSVLLLLEGIGVRSGLGRVGAWMDVLMEPRAAANFWVRLLLLGVQGPLLAPGSRPGQLGPRVGIGLMVGVLG